MSYSLFADAASAPGNPVTISVPYLLAAVSHVDEQTVQLRVANDGYLIALAHARGDEPAVVTAWTGQGQGSGKGRPESWRQVYRREFKDEAKAKARVETLLGQHGGLNTSRPAEQAAGA